MASDALAKLAEAASKDLANDARYSAARVELENMSIALAQELIEKREAGQVLADVVVWMLPLVAATKLPTADQEMRDRFAAVLYQAEVDLDRWNELTETEVRDA